MSLPLAMPRTQPAWWQLLLFCGCLCLALGASQLMQQDKQWLAQEPARRLQLEKAVPVEFAGWRLLDTRGLVEVPAETRASLDSLYNQQLSRTYINADGEKVMLSIAYGEDQSNDQSQAHRPEICYVAQGFQLHDEADVMLALPQRQIQARQLVARLHERNEPITYWMVIGDRVIAPGWQRKLAQFDYALQRQVPDGLLFRVSTLDRDASRAFEVQRRFVTALLSAVDPVTRAHLAGEVVHD
ncbi:exosortase-associated protein EpsI, B-type [Pseudaeromonas sharmana]|uniref:Exosortase-associated protein EpsI, B-type n=1 Tax=Pseudaeromonas sharmana TaxID=328412 RepID=A0ABV8CMV2_9GAMM